MSNTISQISISRFSTLATNFLLFLLPGFVWPAGHLFELPKVIATELIIQLLFVIFLIKVTPKLWQRLDRRYLWEIGVLAALTAFDLIFLRTDQSIFGNQFRFQGLFLLWHLIIWSLISAFHRVHLNWPTVLIAQILLVALIFVIGGDPNQRAVSTLGEPNALAATSLFLWPFATLLTKNRLVKMTALGLAIITIGLSGSRSGLLGLGLQLAFLLITLRFSLAKATLIIVMVALITQALPFLENTSVFEDRAVVWQTSWQAFTTSPLIGHGFGNNDTIFKHFSRQLGNNLQSVYVDSSHNLFLDWAVQGGLIGLCILICLIVLAIKKLIASNQTAILTSFLGLLTALLFNPASVVALIHLWWVIGFAA